MPNNKYQPREEMFVTLGNGLIYVFETNVDTVERNNLGQAPLPAVAPALAFKGGNSPKPRRARRLTADGWNSSFCSAAPATIIPALKTAGWQVGRTPKQRGIITAAGARSVTVYVTVRGIKYAWNMPRETQASLTAARMTGLGIQIATATDIATLVWGASVPRPAKVQIQLSPGLFGADSVSTFVGQAQEDSLPAGFKLMSPRIMFPGDPP